MSVDPMMPGFDEIHILWTSEGMSCDGDTISITNASLPSLEDVVMGSIPGLPKVHLHNKVLSPTLGGDEFMRPFHQAAEGTLGAPFIFVVEGSIPNENINGDGYWTSMGNEPGTAAGDEYVQPDNFMETLLWCLHQAAGLAPVIPLDHKLRPQWLFGKTVHEGCDRAAYYEQGDFAQDYNSPKCQVKVGCWGPVVNCNVPKRGWMGGVGGCPNVGGICIACTMPGFPDKFMPFMDMPPGASLSSMIVKPYGAFIRRMRGITNSTANKEPKWRHNGPELTTGY